MVLTYRYRIKDATTGRHLRRQAREVNRVWNYCVEIHNAARRHNKRWPSGFDLINLTSGSSKLLGLHSDTVLAVCKQFASSRDACGKRPRWRGRKSLRWIPFQAPRAIRWQGDTVIFLGRRYRLWLSRPIEGKILCGGFGEDARGRWYLNLQVKVPEDREHGAGEVGIDLGLKSLVTLSTGQKIEAPRIYRKHERALAIAQRAARKHLLVSGRNVGLRQTEIPSLEGGEDVNGYSSCSTRGSARNLPRSMPRAVRARSDPSPGGFHASPRAGHAKGR